MSTGNLWIDWAIAGVFIVLWGLGSQPFGNWYAAHLDKKRNKVVVYEEDGLVVEFKGPWTKRSMRHKIREIKQETEKIRTAHGS